MRLLSVGKSELADSADHGAPIIKINPKCVV
jgi:hypothetical protein